MCVCLIFCLAYSCSKTGNYNTASLWTEHILVGLSHSGPKMQISHGFAVGAGILPWLEAGTLVTVIFTSCHIDKNR